MTVTISYKLFVYDFFLGCLSIKFSNDQTTISQQASTRVCQSKLVLVVNYTSGLHLCFIQLFGLKTHLFFPKSFLVLLYVVYALRME